MFCSFFPSLAAGFPPPVFLSPPYLPGLFFSSASVRVTGSPCCDPPTLLPAWHSGLAEVLYGMVSPAGRTIQTIYPAAYADEISIFDL